MLAKLPQQAESQFAPTSSFKHKNGVVEVEGGRAAADD